ncbi:uncharacterized protein LOC133907241 [Phragmites australis]|uniref:uncharacterized protein LOC133907241 n=1 Tax=Phragmites australis TaxID=29695 RepID=UPI002D764AB5|nr:uncharacterized protein LOC133907241 [Phragmites australis]
MCGIKAKDRGGSTPLCFAISFAQNASLRMLLKYGASIEVESFLGMPIHLATHIGNIVRILHKANPDVVNSEVYGFCTPLVAAAFYDSTDCFKYLVEAADINAKHLMYKVICYSDSEERSLERVDILLKREMSPNFFDKDILYEELLL